MEAPMETYGIGDLDIVSGVAKVHAVVCANCTETMFVRGRSIRKAGGEARECFHCGQLSIVPDLPFPETE